MNSIRLKITIELNGNHALSVHQLNGLKPAIERGIAAALPDYIAVDTIKVTKVTETRVSEPEDRRAEACPPGASNEPMR